MSFFNDLATGVAYNRTLQETTAFSIPLPKPNWSKFSNKRSCDLYKCPSLRVFKQININGCTCMESGLMTCSGNSITGDEVRRAYTSLNVQKVGTNRYAMVDAATAGPPANCYGGKSYTDMYEALKFGTAGDCASALGCKDDPLKGQFMIDLTGTDYEIDTGSFISVAGWSHRALVTYDDGDGGVDNSNYKIDIPEATQKIEATCGGWGGGCWTTLYVRKIYKHVAGNYYTQKDPYPCKASQRINWKSQCQQAAAAMNREFRDYHDASSKLDGCIWDETSEFVFYADTKATPFYPKDGRVNICSDKGEMKDPNGGRCRDAVGIGAQESGLDSPERGWYDVTGCGACNDYCRYKGTTPCNNGDLTCATAYWSCALAGSGELYTPHGAYTGNMATKFEYSKCDYKGQRVNGMVVQVPKVYGPKYQLYNGDTWAIDQNRATDIILYYSLEGTTSYFRDSLYYGQDRQYVKVVDTENLLKGKSVRNTGDDTEDFWREYTYWLKMVDNHHIRAYSSLTSTYLPIKNYGAIGKAAYPNYLRRMFYSSGYNRATYLMGPTGGDGKTKDSYGYNHLSFGFKPNTAFETFHQSEHGALGTPFAYCENGYDGPKPSNIKYASYFPQGTDRWAIRSVTPTDPTAVYVTTLCRHGTSLCDDPLAENCTVVDNGFWSEYFVPLPEIQNQPFMALSHFQHFLARWDFEPKSFFGSMGNFKEDTTLQAMRSALGASSLLGAKPYLTLFRLQRTPSIYEFTFKIAIKGLSSTVSGTEVGHFRVESKELGKDNNNYPIWITEGVFVQPIEWGTHVNVQHKWFEMKMHVTSLGGYFAVEVFSEANADLVFDGLVIKQLYPYFWETHL